MSAPYEGDSTTPVPGIKGTNTVGGVGVLGSGQGGPGVAGTSDNDLGVLGYSTTSVAVYGYSGPPWWRGGPIVIGGGTPAGRPMPPKTTGVFGYSDLGKDTAGVIGENDAVGAYGVLGSSDKGHGVRGLNDVIQGGSGLHPDRGTGVSGDSTNGYGLWGASKTAHGVYGHSVSQGGVVGESDHFHGVLGIARDPAQPAVSGHSWDRNNQPVPGGLAGLFEGNVTVTGILQANVDVVLGADCAEDFDVEASEPIEPGSVMVIDDRGSLVESREAYDRRVAGVISGAGGFRPGILLDKKQPSVNRLPLALIGKVFCKVDADLAPVEVGDLLTTSSTPGCAMRADDPLRAFGAVIGKALGPLRAGRGLIPILVALQ